MFESVNGSPSKNITFRLFLNATTLQLFHSLPDVFCVCSASCRTEPGSFILPFESFCGNWTAELELAGISVTPRTRKTQANTVN